MNKFELLENKSNLALGDWIKIRAYMLDEIVRDSLTQIEPRILQGRLNTIALTDKWVADFEREKDRLKTKE